MKKIIAHDLEEVSIFKNEFEIVGSVVNPNVMRIYGISTKELDLTTHAIYIIMERANSDWHEEVCNRLQNKKPYTEDELISILKQLVAGLAYLQTINISHRDLKPQNILVFDKSVYKVADFGEAKKIKIAKQLNTLRGTELYMAPILFDGLKENLDDVSHNTYKSDVFSLGYCFLYGATLTFQALYDIRDLKDMQDIIGVLNKYLNNKYSSRLLNLLLKMIDINEQTRCDFKELDTYLKINFS
jgi:serine/threonine protein kinase